MAFRGGADLVVATPGRLLDLVANNALRLSIVQTLVLDEADRLLALGFAEELSQILAHLPVRRQNLLFSATIPQSVATLAEQLLRDPLRVNMDSGASPDATVIVQRAIEVDAVAAPCCFVICWRRMIGRAHWFSSRRNTVLITLR